MKKTISFFILLALLCSVGNAWGTNAEWSDLTKTTSLTVGQITLSGGSFSNSSYQVNGGNTLTMTAASGYVITGAVLTFSADEDNRTGGSKTGTPSVSTGYSYSYNASQKKGTISLTGSSLQALTFTCVSGKAARIVAATISYETSGSGSTTYSVTYDGNGNTSGDVPEDNYSPYESGATVTVMGNTGGLEKQVILLLDGIRKPTAAETTMMQAQEHSLFLPTQLSTQNGR